MHTCMPVGTCMLPPSHVCTRMVPPRSRCCPRLGCGGDPSPCSAFSALESSAMHVHTRMRTCVCAHLRAPPHVTTPPQHPIHNPSSNSSSNSSDSREYEPHECEPRLLLSSHMRTSGPLACAHVQAGLRARASARAQARAHVQTRAHARALTRPARCLTPDP